MMAVKPLKPEDSSALEKAEWKICMVPCIEGPLNTKRSNRFLEAKLYSKLKT